MARRTARPANPGSRAGPRAALSARLYPRKPRRFPQIVLLPAEVRSWVRASAESLDVEISELAEGALRRYLGELDHDRRARGLPPLPALQPPDQSSPREAG